MGNNVEEKLFDGWRTSFLDKNHHSESDYRPQLVLNDYKRGEKVLTSIQYELEKCEEFCISVAFITYGGLLPLLPTLEELENNGVKGKIITTDYLNFSEPEALEKLNNFSNIELRFYKTAKKGFHTKGYIFRRDGVYRMIVGSANLTSAALTQNEEWNTKLIAVNEGEYTNSLLARFNILWNDEQTLPYDEVKEEYTERYKSARLVRQASEHATEEALDVADGRRPYVTQLSPNLMQEEFVENMHTLLARGARRALLISATGTGKTYASAFAVRDFKPQKMLFLVHREQIASQAMKSYKKVLGWRESQKMGLLSGSEKNYNVTYLFSTMQTMAKDETLTKFTPDEFDFIVIDEAHRAGAGSYQKIIDYFKPKMLLGMTASPERTDGYDLYKLFDYNIAYEIRLQQALEEDYLCPFHYFGITDAFIDDEELDDTNLDRAMLTLTDDKRVDFVLEKAEYYRFSGSRIKGLIFCSRNEEARILSEKINNRINPFTGKKYRTISVAGNNSQQERINAVNLLTAENTDGDYLDYIFSVDIFNEGVDIPEINQVIMLRPTQSPIVFVQQLGRGLRKYQDKEFVVVLDFIGNYIENNFMIPIALSGDRSNNKDNIRRVISGGSSIIPGASTINFDKIAKQRIYQSLDNVKLGTIKLIKENYLQLKAKLGKIPQMADFDYHGEMDLTCIFNHAQLGSYYAFLVKYDGEDYTVRLSEIEERFIEYISRKLADGKRPHELELLRLIIAGENNLFSALEKLLLEKYNIKFRCNTRQNLYNIMTCEFITGTGAGKFAECKFIEAKENDFVATEKFKQCLLNPDFKSMVEELIDFGLQRYMKKYSESEPNGLKLYEKYSYEDMCRILEWSKNESAVIGGYKYDPVSNTYPIFINYDKADDISATTAYHDRFLDSGQLISISKNRRTLESEDVVRMLEAENQGIPVELFIRKNKDDKESSKSFYYLGSMRARGSQAITLAGTSAVEILWDLDVPVCDSIYKYITSEVV